MIIYKYKFDVTQLTEKGMVVNTFNWPEKSRVIHIGRQSGDLVLWVLHYKSDSNKDFIIGMSGTGWDLDRYEDEVVEQINTVQLPSGLVFHFFRLFK